MWNGEHEERTYTIGAEDTYSGVICAAMYIGMFYT